MADAADKLRCTLGCWTMGVLAGALAAAMLVLLGGLSWPGAIFTGGLVFVIVGLLLSVLLCKPLPTLAEVQARHAAAAKTAAKPAGSATAEPVARAQAEPAAKAAPAKAPAQAQPAAPAKASAPAKADVPPKAAAPAKAAPAKAAPAKASSAKAPAKADPPPVAADGKPQLLTKARDGGPDDLKQIKGVGPKLEKMLHGMGIYHFDQVASWRTPEIAWVDENIEGFKGRASRDDWVGQAKLLAAGGETEFSKKVEDGDVY